MAIWAKNKLWIYCVLKSYEIKQEHPVIKTNEL